MEDPGDGRTSFWMASDRENKDPEVGNICTACFLCEALYQSLDLSPQVL